MTDTFYACSIFSNHPFKKALPVHNSRHGVQAAAEKYDFDLHWIAGKYFVLCDWYLTLVAMFDDTSNGYSQAVRWMQEEKGA